MLQWNKCNLIWVQQFGIQGSHAGVERFAFRLKRVPSDPAQIICPRISPVGKGEPVQLLPSPSMVRNLNSTASERSPWLGHAGWPRNVQSNAAAAAAAAAGCWPSPDLPNVEAPVCSVGGGEVTLLPKSLGSLWGSQSWDLLSCWLQNVLFRSTHSPEFQMGSYGRILLAYTHPMQSAGEKGWDGKYRWVLFFSH